MASQDPVICVKQLRFGYSRAGGVVVDGVEAELMPGRVTALVGPNAAGKTTLMKLMLGLLEPWEGSVSVAGKPLAGLPPAERARLMSYVPQRPGVRFAFTVREVVAMGGYRSHCSSAAIVDKILEDAGLTDLQDRVFLELSGGQQQRVLLARAQVQTVGRGRAMLLDEPGSHMDLHHRHGMMRRLRELARDGLGAHGPAVLVVLHDLDLAARYADDAWLMDEGRLVAAGSWDQVLTPEVLEPVYRMGLERIETGKGRPLLAVAPGGDTMTGKPVG